MMRSLLIAERFNQKTWRSKHRLPGTREYLRLMLRLGALGPRGRSRLHALGVRWDDAMNLLLPDPRGTSWDYAIAEQVAASTWKYLRYDVVWLVGKKVTGAFFNGTHQFFEIIRPFRELDRREVYVPVPHPSGLNRWWNNTKNLELGHKNMETLTCQIEDSLNR